MIRMKPLFFGFCLLLVLVTNTSLAEDRTNVPAFRCEVYCSQTKMRTTNAKLIWIGPSMPSGPAALAGRVVHAEEIETTVFKNGFDKNLSASFPIHEPAIGTFSKVSEDVPVKFPAYNLKLIRAHKPDISHLPTVEHLLRTPEKQETFVIVEGLEPGLIYRWRLRFKTASGWTESQTVICEAPVCPADFKAE